MGAHHDGSDKSDECSHGYVMGRADPSSENQLKFSSCSIDYFKANILNNGFVKKLINTYLFKKI